LDEQIVSGEQCAIGPDYPIYCFPKMRIWELRARFSVGDGCAVTRNTPRYIRLKQPSCLSKGCQATPQRSLLLDKLCRLATHTVVPLPPRLPRC
jgi:hypothetical protein